jgi:hypothetical protein
MSLPLGASLTSRKYIAEHGRFDALAGLPSAKEIEGARQERLNLPWRMRLAPSAARRSVFWLRIDAASVRGFVLSGDRDPADEIDREQQRDRQRNQDIFNGRRALVGLYCFHFRLLNSEGI